MLFLWFGTAKSLYVLAASLYVISYTFITSELYKLQFMKYYCFALLALVKLWIIVRQFRPDSVVLKWMLGIMGVSLISMSILTTNFYFLFSEWMFLHVSCAILTGVSFTFFYAYLKTQLILIYHKVC